MTYTDAERGRLDYLTSEVRRLTAELAAVRAQQRTLNNKLFPPGHDDYRIALRPHREGADPFAGALMDDIVVKDVPCFRAEDMGEWWWVCCYLEDDDERICWSVRAVRKGVIEWVTTEWPNVVYEHQLEGRK